MGDGLFMSCSESFTKCPVRFGGVDGELITKIVVDELSCLKVFLSVSALCLVLGAMQYIYIYKLTRIHSALRKQSLSTV